MRQVKPGVVQANRRTWIRTACPSSLRREGIRLVGPLAVSAFLGSAPLNAVGDVFFSIDPASPNNGGFSISPDDILTAGPSVNTEGSAFGLNNLATGNIDDINAFSDGLNRVPIMPGSRPVYFSVDRVAVGVSGSAVFTQAQPGQEQAHGDIFKTFPPAGSNVLWKDEEDFFLVAGFFGDDIDAFTIAATVVRKYFSVDRLSASNNYGLGDHANDIHLNNLSTLFADGQTHIGLSTTDDIDALALWDVFEPGVLNPGKDRALFSLDSFSQTVVTGGAAASDVLFTTFDGSFSVYLGAAQIGLRSDDELDGLFVPEPSSIMLFCTALVALQLARGLVRSNRGSAGRSNPDE